MTTLSLEAVADVAYQAGFRGEALVTAVAVSCAENTTHDPARLGDIGLQDAKWGPSVGLWQVRSLNAERGKGTDRDQLALVDANRNARSAYNISGGGTSWKPWTTFNEGTHRQYLDAARAAAATVGQRGGTPATATASSTSSTERSPDILPTLTGVELALKYLQPTTADDIVINKISGWGDLLTDARWDLTASEISELKVSLIDPAFRVLKRAAILVNVAVTWRELEMIVASLEVTAGARDPVLNLAIRPAGAQYMKLEKGDETWANMSRTEVLALLANRWGLDFVGEGSARVATLARQTSGTSASRSKSSWDMAKEFANDLGFWMFEAAGTLYFGRPSWLADHLVEVKVGWGGAWGDDAFDAIEIPNAKRSFDSTVTVIGDTPGSSRDVDPDTADTVPTPVGKQVVAASVSIKLPRWRGEAVRPGMKVNLKGVPTFDGFYIVTKVNFALDSTSDVDVEAVEPLDPMPADTTAYNDAAATGASSTAATESARNAEARTGWEGIDQAVAALGLRMGKPTVGQTTGGNHVTGSEHYAGRARDYGDADSDAAGIARALVKYATGGANAPIDELFFSPLDIFYDSGAKFSPSAALRSGHQDHCHVGVRSGIALLNYIPRPTLPDPAGQAARDKRVA